MLWWWYSPPPLRAFGSELHLMITTTIPLSSWTQSSAQVHEHFPYGASLWVLCVYFFGLWLELNCTPLCTRLCCCSTSMTLNVDNLFGAFLPTHNHYLKWRGRVLVLGALALLCVLEICFVRYFLQLCTGPHNHNRPMYTFDNLLVCFHCSWSSMNKYPVNVCHTQWILFFVAFSSLKVFYFFSS